MSSKSRVEPGASTRTSRHEWNRAYATFPNYLAPIPWPHITELLEAHPGERVYEVGFGSGSNLKWAYDNGWEVAGCEVADLALDEGRALLPEADLRLESIADCSAPSEYFDVVIDRAAMACLTDKEMKKALAQIRRIPKPGGLFFFNPYGMHHTFPFPPDMPSATLWEDGAVRRLFPETKWDFVDMLNAGRTQEIDGRTVIEHTLRVLVRKTEPRTAAQ